MWVRPSATPGRLFLPPPIRDPPAHCNLVPSRDETVQEHEPLLLRVPVIALHGLAQTNSTQGTSSTRCSSSSANLSPPPPRSLQIQNLEGRAKKLLSTPKFPQIDGASPPWSFLDDAAASSGL
ncbi:hypothetical protein J3E68DRAFT_202759 [Trichoderma sp. SZMC 28012]